LELSNTYNFQVVCQLFGGIVSNVIVTGATDVSQRTIPSFANNIAAPETTREILGYGVEFNIIIEEI
jgi:hypothetical protein